MKFCKSKYCLPCSDARSTSTEADFVLTWFSSTILSSPSPPNQHGQSLAVVASVGVGYVQSLLNHYAAKNAVKKSTYSYVDFMTEAFIVTHFPPLRGVGTPCSCFDSTVLGGSGFPTLLPCPVPTLFWVGRRSLPCLAECPAGNFFIRFGFTSE
jgi:hypothetical protein